MICPQTPLILYGFNGNEMRSPGTITLLFRAYPYNVIMEFYVIDMESPLNLILRRPWIHMTKVVLSSYHQLLRYPTLMRTVRGPSYV